MNLRHDLLAYFAEEQNDARLFIPELGKIIVKHYRGFEGRDPATGRKVSVPESHVPLFAPLSEDDFEENESLEHWLKAKQGKGDSSTIERELAELVETVKVNLSSSDRAEIPGLGRLIKKERPPLVYKHPRTGEISELPARSITVFKEDWSFKVALNPDLAVESPESGFIPAPAQVSEGISSFSLEDWPEPAELWKLFQSLAVLSLCHNDPTRYVALPNLRSGMNYAAFSNQQGDSAAIFVAGNDALIRGFAHEAPMASAPRGHDYWPGTLDGLPEHWSHSIYRDYLEAEPMSFCVWYSDAEKEWRKGEITQYPEAASDDPDGSALIYSYFTFDPKDYVKYESEHYSRKIPLKAVKRIFEHEPLTAELIRAVNPKCKIPLELFARTGYPIAE